MSTQSKIPNESALKNGAPSIESVRKWREAVNTFFTEDWEQLRTLVMDLEESIWTDDELERQRETAYTTQPIPTDLLQQIGEIQVQNEPPSDLPDRNSDTHLSHHRLAELSKKIEARLSAQHEQQSPPID